MVKGSTFVMQITDIDGDTTTDDLIPECNKFDQRDTVDTPNGVLYPAGVGSPEGTFDHTLGENSSREHIMVERVDFLLTTL
jgi:hypothetical protein